MKRFADIDLHPSASDLRSLRWTLLLGGAAVSSVMWFGYHRTTAATSCAGAIAALLLLSFIPGVGRFVFIAWMGLGVAMGTITTPVLLGVVWLSLFLPLGVFFRLVGRDPLRRRPLPPGTSYWTAHETPSDVRSYFRQF